MRSLRNNPHKFSGRETRLPVPHWPSKAAGKAVCGGLLLLMMLAAVGCGQSTRKPKQEHFLRGATGPIAFTPDGKRLLTCSQTNLGNVKAWDPATGRKLSVFTGPELSYTTRSGGSSHVQLSLGEFVLSPKGTLAASHELDPSGPVVQEKGPIPEGGVLLLWDSVTGKVVHSVHVGRVRTPIAFSPDGSLVAVTDELASVKLVDVQTGKVLSRPKFPSPAPESIWALSFSPDSKRLACASFIPEGGYGAISVWDIATGDRVWAWGDASVGHHTIAFSPDGRLVAASGVGGVIHVRDAHDGKHGYTLTGHEGLVYKLAFHPNGRQLASTASDSTVRIWDLRSKKVIHILKASPHPASDIAFSPEGKWLAGACGGDEDGGVIVWNLQPTTEEK